MAFCKNLFSQKHLQPELTPKFSRHVETAIHLFDSLDNNLTDEALFQILLDNGIDESDAVEILLFLPIAFTRRCFPMVKWSDTYSEYQHNQKQAKRKFSKTKSHLIIDNITKAYFTGKTDRDLILKIATRSADFDALNQAFNDNPNTDLRTLKVAYTMIMR